MYTTKPAIILGFHGCEITRRDELLNKELLFYKSEEDYDWLGHGMYFWEGNYDRALQWANDKHGKNPKEIPAVIGAVIDLGYCFDLVDSRGLNILKRTYEELADLYKEIGSPLPTNEGKREGNTSLKKVLDCQVIEFVHLSNLKNKKENNRNEFDSVRGVFWEGDPLYNGTEHREKNHIQICIRNPNCIKGFFLPRELDKEWNKLL